DRLHDHTGRTEAALQRMAFVERLSYGVQLAVLFEPLDRAHLVTVGLYGEHRAGLDASTVEMHCARAAVGGIASDDSAGFTEPLTEILHEQHPGFDIIGVHDLVDGEA